MSTEELEHYRTQGYLVLRGLLSRPELDRLDARFHDVIMGRAPCEAPMKAMQDVMVVKGAVQPETPIHAVNKLLCLEEDAVLFGYAKHPRLVQAVQSLLGPELYSLSSNIFNKPPGVDGRHPLHQDLRYFRLRPADGIVGTWTAMLPARREHGCLSVIPGSHTRGLLSHALPDWEYVNHGFYAAQDVEVEQRVHVELEPGDTLLFHPLIVHGSGRNRSDAFRRAISVHYAAGTCESDKPGWQQRGLTRRIA